MLAAQAVGKTSKLGEGMSEKIELDGKEYKFDELSETARATIASIQYCDERLEQLQSQWAVADTARLAYTAALVREVKAK